MRTSDLVVPKHKPLDDYWYKELIKKLGPASEIYTILGPDTERLQILKLDFYKSNCLQNVNLQPANKFHKQQVDKCAAELMRLKERLLNADLHGGVKLAYCERIDELLTNLAMYTAAYQNDVHVFNNANTKIYGEPIAEIYNSVLAYYHSFAEGCLTQNNLRVYAEQLLEVLPQPKGTLIALEPSSQVFDYQYNIHWQPKAYYDQLFEGDMLQTSGHITQAEGDQIVNKILKSIGATDHRIKDSEGMWWGVLFKEKAVVRPVNYQLQNEDFLGTIGHEIGSHLLERVNGERQKLQLLGLGLAGYERTNEGRALLREQVAYNSMSDFYKQTRWQDILRRHLSICLGRGIQQAPMTFSQVFLIMNLIDQLWERQKDNQDSRANEYANMRSWELLIRSLKGTSGNGGAYLKDVIYLQGNILCWQAAQNNPNLISYGDYGKFDITDKKSLELLQNLKVLPSTIGS